MAYGEGTEYFGTYIPSATEAAEYRLRTGRAVVRLATDIEAEFGTGRNPLVVEPIDLEFGGAEEKLRAGPRIPDIDIHYDL